MTDKYQIIILELSDGRKVKAAILAFCEIGDELSIIGFQVTEPRELADDCQWSTIKGIASERTD